MAVAISPSIDLNNLSSNWKKLQATLKTDSTNAPKRTSDESVLQPKYNGAKRRKLEAKPGATKAFQNREIPMSGTMAMGRATVGKEAPSASLALWAEDNDISVKDLAAAYGTSLKSTSISNIGKSEDKVNEGLSTDTEAGKYIAVDCEMVGVGPTPNADSALARVSIVNYHGHQLYDSFVLPKEAVTDYRTFVSGITPELLRVARTLEVVQADIASLLDGRILIGHSIKNDLAALLLGHPAKSIRDTSKYAAFKQLAGGKTPSLKKLARDVLGVDIQGGEHSSIEDARAAMLLFRREKEHFEREHLKKWGPQPKGPIAAAGNEGPTASGKKNRKKKKK